MGNKNIVKLFDDRKVRTIWNEDEEKWYFSIVDVVTVLTDSDNPQTYWRVLKIVSKRREMKPLQIVTL